MVSFPSLMAQEKKLSKEEDDARIDKYEKQLQDYLVNYIVEGYDDRAAKLWNRDYSSGYALERSVEPNRRRWEQVIKPPVLEKTGSLKKSPYEVNGVHAEWITLPLGDITAEGILAFPKEASKEDPVRSEEHTSELQSRENLVCRLLLEKKKHHRKRTGLPRIRSRPLHRTAAPRTARHARADQCSHPVQLSLRAGRPPLPPHARPPARRP